MCLTEAVVQASRAFDRVTRRTWCVKPAVPILFFGDLDAYRASPLRVLTVGLNPSRHEFPADQPFRRFPLAEDSLDGEPSCYLDAMSAYFRTEPYDSWFSAFKPLLNGMKVSYYLGGASTALHTDICSPVATNPTWSKLDEVDRAALESDGDPLWHMLLEELKPQIVALSVAKAHLKRIKFKPLTNWEVIHTFKRKANGDSRLRPYEIHGRWYEVGGERSLFIFGRAAQKPFGLLSSTQKKKAGALGLDAYQEGRYKRCFIQFPHPGKEHSSGAWNNKTNGHKRRFMQVHGDWIEKDGTKRTGDLWVWGEWEPESNLIREFNAKHGGPYHPRYLWEPYWAPREDSYQGLHNTDPFIFGDCFLYSNCGQLGRNRRGLKHLDQGSVIVFGSGKKADGEKKWMLDTVLVVRDGFPYDPLALHKGLGCKVPDAFLHVTGGPLAADLAENPEKGGFRLYRGATPDDPVRGMFSFFPAMPANGDAGFARPFISLQGESFNPRNWRSPKGHGRNCRGHTLKDLRRLWNSLVTHVRDVGLVLGTRAEVPPRMAAMDASNDLKTDRNRSLGATGQVPLSASGCGGYAQP